MTTNNTEQFTHTFDNGSTITARTIRIHSDLVVGKNVHINCTNTFSIGKYGRFGDNVTINADNVIIGDHFFHHTPRLVVGGGGSPGGNSNLRIGHRCVLHNNYINLAMPVYIGNDVGLSPDVQILTHGFWANPLLGYPSKYESVLIGDNVIIGQGSLINIGARICDDIVIGAKSVVCGTLDESCSIYAGSPAKKIRSIYPVDSHSRKKFIKFIIDDWNESHVSQIELVSESRSIIRINNFCICLTENRIVKFGDSTFEQNNLTDAVRDHLRRHGIKIYTERPFGNSLTFDKKVKNYHDTPGGIFIEK